MNKNKTKRFSWTYTCKTIIVSSLIIIAFTSLAFCGWEIHRGNDILGSALVGLIATIVGSLSWTLKYLLHHERRKTKNVVK